MKTVIHFQDKSRLTCKEASFTYIDSGIVITAEEGNIFVPYSAIKYVSEKVK